MREILKGVPWLECYRLWMYLLGANAYIAPEHPMWPHLTARINRYERVVFNRYWWSEDDLGDLYVAWAD